MTDTWRDVLESDWFPDDEVYTRVEPVYSPIISMNPLTGQSLYASIDPTILFRTVGSVEFLAEN